MRNIVSWEGYDGTERREFDDVRAATAFAEDLDRDGFPDVAVVIGLPDPPEVSA